MTPPAPEPTHALDPRRFDAITFDCYGTLIDWETGILAALGRLFDVRSRPRPSPRELLAAFARLEPRAQRPPFRSYRSVLREVAFGVGQEFGISATDEEASAFAASVGDWPAFGDTTSALRALASRYRLAVVSNVDDDLFAPSAAKLGVSFAAVVTALQVRSYKPAPAHFLEALNRLDLPRSRLLHAAQSLYHDVAPAKELGIATVWINRASATGSTAGATAPSSARADWEFRDLESLAGALARD